MTQVLVQSVRTFYHIPRKGGVTYTMSNPKTVIRVTFLYVAICSWYGGYMGRPRTIASVMRLIIPVTVKGVTWSPHFPLTIVLSQLYANGRHIKNPARIVAVAQTMTMDMVAYEHQ